MDTKGLVNLDYVVRLVLMDLDDYSMTKYKKFLQYAILGYQDLNISTMTSLKVAYLPVNKNKTVDLPYDYIDYSKIGYNSGGKITTLTLNDNLMLTRNTDNCGNPINENTKDCSGTGYIYSYYYVPHYRDGQYIGEIYGGGGTRNSAGYYRIDYDKRQICLSSEFSADTLILEYKSSGVNEDGTTLIPRQCIESLRAYIHWKRKEYNDKIPRGEKESLRQSYYIEFEKLRDLEYSFTLEEYYDSRRSTYSQSPKR